MLRSLVGPERPSRGHYGYAVGVQNLHRIGFAVGAAAQCHRRARLDGGGRSAVLMKKTQRGQYTDGACRVAIADAPLLLQRLMVRLVSQGAEDDQAVGI